MPAVQVGHANAMEGRAGIVSAYRKNQPKKFGRVTLRPKNEKGLSSRRGAGEAFFNS